MATIIETRPTSRPLSAAVTVKTTQCKIDNVIYNAPTSKEITIQIASNETSRLYHAQYLLNISSTRAIPAWDEIMVIPQTPNFENDEIQIYNISFIRTSLNNITVDFDISIKRSISSSTEHLSSYVNIYFNFVNGVQSVFNYTTPNNYSPYATIYNELSKTETATIALTDEGRDFVINYDVDTIEAPEDFFAISSNVDTNSIEIYNNYNTDNASSSAVSSKYLRYYESTNTFSTYVDYNIELNQPDRVLDLTIRGISTTTGRYVTLKFIVPFEKNPWDSITILPQNRPTSISYKSYSATYEIYNTLVQNITDIEFIYDDYSRQLSWTTPQTYHGVLIFEVDQNNADYKRDVIIRFTGDLDDRECSFDVKLIQESIVKYTSLPIVQNYTLTFEEETEKTVNMYTSTIDKQEDTVVFSLNSFFSGILKPINNICKFNPRYIALNYMPTLGIDLTTDYIAKVSAKQLSKSSKSIESDIPLFKIATADKEFFYSPYYDYINNETDGINDYCINRLIKKEVFNNVPYYISTSITWGHVQHYDVASNYLNLGINTQAGIKLLDNESFFNYYPSVKSKQYLLNLNTTYDKLYINVESLDYDNTYDSNIEYNIRYDFNRYFGMIYYVNSLGGIDWLPVNNASLQKNTYTNASITLPEYSGNNLVLNKNNYIKSIKKTWTLKSDLINDEEMKNVHNLYESQCIKLYVRETEKWYDVNITDTSFTQKTFNNNSHKLFNISFNVECQETINKFQ